MKTVSIRAKSKVLCIHHNDYDGLCSAAILNKKYPNDIEFFEIDHGTKAPLEKIKNNTVFILDFSFPKEEMLEVINSASIVTWIDHHGPIFRSFNKYVKDKKITSDFRKHLVEGKAACQLCWEYFFNTELPKTIELIAKYDIWDKESTDVDKFNQYLSTLTEQELRPKSRTWEDLFSLTNKELYKRLIIGSYILKSTNNKNKYMLDSTCFDLNWENYNWLCANSVKGGTDYFESKFSDKYDGTLAFHLNSKKTWTISLRSQTIDTSIISKKYGGGGHKAASGFSVEKLPFDLG